MKKTIRLITLLLFVLIFTGGAFADITTLTIREKAGVTTSNYPLTFGHVFMQGDVLPGQDVAVSINGALQTTQFDIKRRYADGSVRHGVVSVVLPSVQANQDLELTLIAVTENSSGSAMTKSEILATGVESLVNLTGLDGSGYSGNLTADLNQAIADDASLDYWLSGPVVTEILVNQRLNNSLNATWEARFYPGWNGIRISNAMENVEGDYRGNINYAVDLQMGDNDNSLASHYAKAAFQHNRNARWRKVLWIGQEPPEVEVRYDFRYMIESGHVMNYAVDEFNVPEGVIETEYANWLSSDRDIMETSSIQVYFGTTGDRAEIGALPLWTVRYLFSMDNRMREKMLNFAELFSGAPVHYRESDNTRSFYGHIISVDDRPSVWLNREDFQYQDAADRLPDPIGATGTVWSVDRAHQASYAYVPYMITGEKYYLDELYYWAGYNLAACSFNPDYGRDYDRGLVRDQVRGEAWAIRNIAEAAALAPDGDMEKAYLEEKIQNNMDQWLYEQEQNEAGNRYPFNAWGINVSHRNDGEFEDENGYSNINGTTSGWHEDFMLLILGHLDEMGYAAKPIIDRYHKFVVNRYSHPDFNPYNGDSYHFPLQYTEDRIPRLEADRRAGPYLVTWREANDAYTDQPTRFRQYDDDYPFSYRYISLAVLSLVTEYTVEQNLDSGGVNYASGLATYEWLRDSLYDRHELNEDPRWAIVPREPSAEVSLQALFSVADATIEIGQSIQFTDASNGSPTTWSWDFGDGQTSTVQNPTHTYQSVGTYTVSLTVTNGSDSDTQTRTNFITVTEPAPDNSGGGSSSGGSGGAGGGSGCFIESL